MTTEPTQPEPRIDSAKHFDIKSITPINSGNNVVASFTYKSMLEPEVTKAYKAYIDSNIHNTHEVGAKVPLMTETDDKIINIPITIGFDYDFPPAGTMHITKKALQLLEKRGMVLAPSYTDDQEYKILSLAIIPATYSDSNNPVVENNASQPERDASTTLPVKPNGFLWHLFLIAMVSGLLAIIGLIVRLFYVRG